MRADGVVEGMGVGVGMMVTMSGKVGGTGIAACVVVLSAGANALASMASGLKGHMPVF